MLFKRSRRITSGCGLGPSSFLPLAHIATISPVCVTVPKCRIILQFYRSVPLNGAGRSFPFTPEVKASAQFASTPLSASNDNQLRQNQAAEAQPPRCCRAGCRQDPSGSTAQRAGLQQEAEDEGAEDQAKKPRIEAEGREEHSTPA